jgi:hypothetical protein
MAQDNVLNKFNSLPPEGQKQVLDFIAFLQTRYGLDAKKENKSKNKLADETFIGIWRNREDLKDSSAWVRKIRAAEWS